MKRLCLIGMSVAIASAAAEARSEDIPQVEGAYGSGSHPRYFFYYRNLGTERTLQFTDTVEGTVRLLRRDGAGLVAGPTLTALAPVTLRFSFGRDRVRICGTETSRCIVARRHRLRQAPVDFTSDQLRLFGTLWLPAERGCYPGILIAQGSEDSDRNAIDPLPQVLASRGFAVLAFDKRGTGQSNGSWQESGIEELASDIRGIFESALLSNPEIDRRQTGALGFSEGTWTVVEAIRQGTDFRFLIALSGGAFSKGESLLFKERRRLEEQGVEGDELERRMREHRATVEAAARRVAGADHASGFDRRISYDPAPAWLLVRAPVLWIAGQWDVLEDQPRSARRIAELLARAGNGDHMIATLPNANHALFEAPTPNPSDWARMASIERYASGFWQLLSRWLADRTTGSTGRACR